MTNRDVVSGFLASYQKHQAEKMIECLHEETTFSDLAFEKIEGKQVEAMWRWFCEKPVEVPSFEVAQENGNEVRARYRVRYSVEKGVVDYVIAAKFTVERGKIIRQVDEPTISDYAFAKMVMGFPARLLAFTPLFKRIIRRTMWKKLEDYQN
jgi:hypothetical protein